MERISTSLRRPCTSSKTLTPTQQQPHAAGTTTRPQLCCRRGILGQLRSPLLYGVHLISPHHARVRSPLLRLGCWCVCMWCACRGGRLAAVWATCAWGNKTTPLILTKIIAGTHTRAPIQHHTCGTPDAARSHQNTKSKSRGRHWNWPGIPRCPVSGPLCTSYTTHNRLVACRVVQDPALAVTPHYLPRRLYQSSPKPLSYTVTQSHSTATGVWPHQPHVAAMASPCHPVTPS